MPKNPLVSIVTPNYNKAEYLEETIKSVIIQDYPNIEYIVVDGGSTDGSVDIIKKYNQHITKWVSEPDLGQSHAINKGWQMSNGEALAYINSDDLYFPGAVSNAVDKFQKDPDLSVFYGIGVFLSSKGDFHSYFENIEPYNRFRILSCTDFILQPASFFKRSSLEAVGFLNENLHYCMDWDLYCRLARDHYSFLFDPSLIAAARLYPDTKTLSGGHERFSEIWKLLMRYKQSWWPHAFFGFLATHYHDKVHNTDSNSSKLCFRLVQFICAILNFHNLHHSRSNKSIQQIGSFGVHYEGTVNQGYCVLNQNAILAMPYYRIGRKIVMTISPNTKACVGPHLMARVRLNDEHTFNFNLPTNIGSHKIELDLPHNNKYLHYLKVSFSFSGALNNNYPPAFMKGFKMVA